MSDMSDSLRFYPSPAPMKYYTYQDEDIQRAKSLVQRGSSQTMAAEDMNKRAKQTLLKEYATNEKKTCTVLFQDVSHNINLMRIGKWRQLNRISLF